MAHRSRPTPMQSCVFDSEHMRCLMKRLKIPRFFQGTHKHISRANNSKKFKESSQDPEYALDHAKRHPRLSGFGSDRCIPIRMCLVDSRQDTVSRGHVESSSG